MDQNFFSYNYWFGKIGIEIKDIPMALVYFKTMSYASYIAIFGLSYRYRLINKFLSSNTGLTFVKNTKLHFPKLVNKIDHYSQKMSQYLSTNKYFQRIPITLGLKTKRFTEALVETTVIYKLSLPLYFYGTYKLISNKNKLNEIETTKTNSTKTN